MYHSIKILLFFGFHLVYIYSQLLDFGVYIVHLQTTKLICVKIQ